MTNCKCWSFLIITVGVIYVSTDETEHDSFNSDSDKQKKEYKNVFRSIPIVFEYLIQMLEDKPEVLERNDVATFQLSDDREKRSAGEFRDDKINEAMNDNEDFKTKDILGPSLLKYPNKPEKVLAKNKIVGERKVPAQDNTSVDMDNDDRFKSGVDEIEKLSEWINFQGADFSFNLTPEEVAEQVVKVEQMLEDYNKT